MIEIPFEQQTEIINVNYRLINRSKLFRGNTNIEVNDTWAVANEKPEKFIRYCSSSKI